MKMTKRFLSTLLVLAMVLALCPVITFTATAAETETENPYQDFAYATKTNGAYTGASKAAKDLTYLSVDGDDEDTTPDLILEYYTHNQTSKVYEYDADSTTDYKWVTSTVSVPYEPAWNSSIGSGFYTRGSNSIAAITKNSTATSSGYDYSDELGHWRVKNGGTWYSAKLYLGYNTTTKLSTEMPYGIGVQPALDAPAYLTFNVEDYNTFYSVVGITGSAFNAVASNILSGTTVTVNGTTTVSGSATSGATSNKTGANTVTFSVYGSTVANAAAADSSFVLLAESEVINGWESGEFDVDITDYKTLKLVVTGNGDSICGCESAWGNACVYNSETKVEKLGVAQPEGVPENADITNLSALYSDYTQGATDHAYVKDSFVIGSSSSTASPRLFKVNMPFFGRQGVYSYTDGTLKYSWSDWDDAATWASITLGAYGTVCETGLSFTPTGTDKETADAYISHVVFDVSSLEADWFYSLVGLTGKGNNYSYSDFSGGAQQYLSFYVYGSKDETYSDSMTYELLADCDNVTEYCVGEFNVNIEGYNFLKLVCDNQCGSWNNEAAWGNACVYNVNPYEGKKVSILGDSISTWSRVSNDVTANNTIGGNKGYYGAGVKGLETRQDTWWQQAIDALGMELVVNNSWGGSCVLTARSSVDDNGKETLGAASVGWDTRCVNLHNNNEDYEETPDVILVFMGTNDFSYYQDTLGTYEAINFETLVTGDGAAPTTACEAYAVMLARMQAMYPEAEIWCMTPLPRETGLAVGDPTSFCTDLAQVAAHYGCGVINMSSLFGTDTATYHTYISDDDVHPLKAGMDAITEAVVGALLGETTTLYDVDYDLTNVESVDGHSVIAGDSYTATLRAAEEVTVTMGGEDITASCYANGVVNIEKVTGDVTITASSDSIEIDSIGKDDSVKGRLPGVNVQYLSALHDSTTAAAGDRTQVISNGTNDYVVSTNRKVTLNESYSYPNFYFSSGSRYQSNGGSTAVDGTREINGVTYNTYGIHLGYVAKTYTSGLGVHPNAVGGEDSAIVYNVSNLGNRFYAVVGVNGNLITNADYYSRYVNFEVWGSTDGENYERIAHALNLRVYLTAEFDIDISGYNYIKLVTRMTDESRDYSSCAAAWADACVYDAAIESYGFNIRLHADLKIGYYFTVDSAAGAEAVGAKLYKGDTLVKEGTNLTATSGVYGLEGSGICAQDIGDVYTLVPYYTIGEDTYEGEAIEYSVLDYCKKVYSMTDGDWEDAGYTATKGANTKNLAIDLLNYATAASVYLDGTSAKTYNSFLTDDEKSVDWNADTHEAEHDESTGSISSEFIGRNINLDEAINLGVYFKPVEGAFACYFNDTDYPDNSTGDVTTETIDGGYVKYVVKDEVYANNIYDNYYIRVYDDTDTYADYHFCVAAYLTELMNDATYGSNEKLVALCKAMQVYGYNAKTYFATDSQS